MSVVAYPFPHLSTLGEEDLAPKRKRKDLGREICLNETADILRALQEQHRRLAAAVSTRARSVGSFNQVLHSQSIGTSDSFNRTSFRDILSSATLSSSLHHAAFLDSTSPQALIPLHMEETSTYVDCNHAYAEMMRVSRDVIIRGCKPSILMARTTFLRLVGLTSLAERYKTILVRNVPRYSPRGAYDGIISVEYEVCSHPLQPGKRVRVPKFLRLVMLNLRTFSSQTTAVPEPSVDTSFRAGGSDAKREEDAFCESLLAPESFVSQTNCDAKAMTTCVSTTSAPGICRLLRSVAHHLLPLCWWSHCLNSQLSPHPIRGAPHG